MSDTTCRESTGFAPVGQQQLSAAAAPTGRRLLVLAAITLACAAMALSVDCRVSQFCKSDRKATEEGRRQIIPNSPRRILQWSEAFGHGFGVLAVTLLIYQLDPSRRRALPRVLAMAFGAGLAADICKMLVVRIRPREFEVLPNTVWDTFTRWFPLGRGMSGDQSFPSAHTATAAALAVALWWLYPRGRWLFAAMAVLVACQRVEAGAHYPSDVLFGATVGLVVAAGCLACGPLARTFGRWERNVATGA